MKNLVQTPETDQLVFDQLSIRYQPYSERALGHTALEALLPYEIEAIEGAPSHYRGQVVDDVVSYAQGELTHSDFNPQTTIEGLPHGFSEGRFIPNVKIPLKDLSDLPRFVGQPDGSEMTASAIDVFIPDSAHKGEAIRLIDLRSEIGVDVDKKMLTDDNNAVQLSLDDRFARDVQSLFNNSTVHRVLRAKIATYYAQASGNKLRTYWRYVSTDRMPTQDDEYRVIRTIVRLADCASEDGEEKLYPRLFGFRM